jgi:hypothetical protein
MGTTFVDASSAPGKGNVSPSFYVKAGRVRTAGGLALLSGRYRHQRKPALAGFNLQLSRHRMRLSGPRRDRVDSVGHDR